MRKYVKYSCQITTDTATICVFDLLAIRHRKDDAGDWWSIPADRIVECQKRNALFIDVGDDGSYHVEVTLRTGDEQRGFCLATPSGQIFIGPGEETSGGEFEPDGKWGGIFISVDSPYQMVEVSRDENMISLNISPTEAFDNEPVDMIPLR